MIGRTCLATACVLSLSGALAASHPELVADGEFENPDSPWKMPDNGAFSIVKGEGRNGTSALVYSNDDPARPYAFPMQTIAGEKGKVYSYGAWIRAENLKPKGNDTGATVFVEWFNAEGRCIGGDYAPGVKRGTTDGWVHVKWVTKPLPPETAKVTAGVYASRGATGRVWFDDVSVVEYGRDPVSAVISSAYRNAAASGTVSFHADLAVPADMPLEKVKAAFVHYTSEGVKRRVPVALTRRDTAAFSCAVTDLPLGRSPIGFELRAPDDTVLGRAAVTFERLAEPKHRRVSFDDSGRTIVDGKPFFPLGMFISRKEGREILADSPFNCVMSYLRQDEADMDWWHARGFKVIYCVKDIFAGTGHGPAAIKTESDETSFLEDCVRRFANHPALLAWYTNDEFPVSYVPRLAARRNLMEKLDPEHPTWTVQYQIDQMRDYLPTYDVIGTDPYPVGEKPLSMAGEWTRKTVESAFGKRPVWQVPQAFDWTVYRSGPPHAGDRMPTLAEMRSMAWQCIAGGANGLVWYSFTGLQSEKVSMPFEKSWADVVAMVGEIRSHESVLLADRGPDIPAPADCLLRTWSKDGKVFLLVVNLAADMRTINLEMPVACGKANVLFGPAASSDGRVLSLSLGSCEPAMYGLEVK